MREGDCTENSLVVVSPGNMDDEDWWTLVPKNNFFIVVPEALLSIDGRVSLIFKFKQKNPSIAFNEFFLLLEDIVT